VLKFRWTLLFRSGKKTGDALVPEEIPVIDVEIPHYRLIGRSSESL